MILLFMQADRCYSITSAIPVCVYNHAHKDDREDIGVSKRLLQTDLCARFNGQHLDTFL